MKKKNPNLKQVLRELLGFEASLWVMARLFSAPAPSSCPLWGLMVLDNAGDLHFISFTQKNWISDLITPTEADKGPLRAHECYPRKEIRSLRREKKGFLSSLINPSFRYALFLTGQDEAVLFELENPDRQILDALDSYSS